MAAGSCFGFAVRSQVPLTYLRDAHEGDDALLIEEGEVAPPGDDDRVVLELPPESGRLHARIHEHGDGYLFWMAGGGWYRVEPGRNAIVVPPAEVPVDREERMWGVPALLCFTARGDLPLHAAAVQVGDEAVILTGETTAGKTTLAAAFHAAGHRVLSEDLVCYRLAPRPAVVPGPAMLRLRRDAAAELRLPGAREVGRDDDRLHLAPEEGRRGDCRPVPIRAVVFLGEADGPPALEPVPVPEAIRLLWPQSFTLPGDAETARSFAGIADLASAVPLWRLVRRKTWDALAATVDHIAAHA